MIVGVKVIVALTFQVETALLYFVRGVMEAGEANLTHSDMT